MEVALEVALQGEVQCDSYALTPAHRRLQTVDTVTVAATPTVAATVTAAALRRFPVVSSSSNTWCHKPQYTRAPYNAIPNTLSYVPQYTAIQCNTLPYVAICVQRSASKRICGSQEIKIN